MPEFIAGDARIGTGLAGLIADKIKEYERTYNPQVQKGWYMPNAIAEAVIEYLRENAVVVSASDPTDPNVIGKIE